MEKNFRNELLKRKEVKIVMSFESNPSLDKARTAIAQEMKVGEDVIAIKGIHSRFGRKEFLIDALVYDSAEEKLKIEPKVKAVKKAAGAQ